MSIKIALTQITPEDLVLRLSKPADGFGILKEMVSQGEATSFGPLDIVVTLTARQGYFDVKGTVSTDVGLICSRCLRPFNHALRQQFSLRFSQEIPQDLNPEEDAELELTADQIGLVYFKGNELDLKEAIQEQVVLALPFKPLCHESCKGLCPKCGADLNTSNCQCGNNGNGSPFDLLKQLKLK